MNGMQIGHFRIVKLLAEGELGQLFEAFDESLNREVVIKVLYPQLSQDPTLISYFLKEVQSAATINHPNVVQIYFFGKENGSPYVVMEMVKGQSGDDLLHEKVRLPETMVISLAIEIVQGLKAAHEKGILHGDLSPQNILIDEKRRVKLLGFGFSNFKVQITKSQGHLGGTLNYVSPERVKGEVEDHRSDIYSLGAVLFHLLGGRPPFWSKDAAELATKRLKEKPTELLQIAPGTSKNTLDLINKMLQADPNERFQSYDEMEECLLQIQQRVISANVSARPEVKSGLELPKKVVSSERKVKSKGNDPVISRPRNGRKKVAALVVVGMLGLLAMLWPTLVGTKSNPEFHKTVISFQKKDSVAKSLRVEGARMLIDNGELYGSRPNGYFYGWSTGPVEMRERTSSKAKSPLHNNLAYFPEGQSSWQIQIPNGNYHLRLVAGDPDYIWNKIFFLSAEDVPFLTGLATIEDPWVEAEGVIAVSDGALTINRRLDAFDNCINLIEITKVEKAPSPVHNTIRILAPQEKKVLTSPAKLDIPFEIAGGLKLKKITLYDGSLMLKDVPISSSSVPVDNLSVGMHWFLLQGVREDGQKFCSEPWQVKVQSAHDHSSDFPIKIKFQPDHLPINPEITETGYFIDIGEPFERKAGGLAYGWNEKYPNNWEHFFQSPFSPDARYDSARNLSRGSKYALWEIEVENGNYEVRLVSGQPFTEDTRREDTKNCIHKIYIENIMALEGKSVHGQYWFNKIAQVQVRDGRLSVRAAEGDKNTTICFIEIRPI